MKTLKFMPHLAEMILRGEKTCTWRFFDEKGLQIGDKITFINKKSGEVFGTAKIMECYPKTFGTLSDEDYIGHEGFTSEEEMYKTYRSYYPDREVGPDTELKVVRFEFEKN